MSFLRREATQKQLMNWPHHCAGSKHVLEHLAPYKTVMWSGVLSTGASQKQLALMGLRTKNSEYFPWDRYSPNTFWAPGMVPGPSRNEVLAFRPWPLHPVLLTRLSIYASSSNFLKRLLRKHIFSSPHFAPLYVSFFLSLYLVRCLVFLQKPGNM